MAKKKAKKKATTKKASSKSKKKGAQEVLVVGSKVKAALKASGCNSSSDVSEALNMYLHWVIEQASARAKANGRKTVRGHDILIG